jgi:hypothetical protein
VATDVRSGWTELTRLVARQQSPVVEGLDVLRRQSSMPIRGIESDNDGGFINVTLLTSHHEQKPGFTRSRANQKNDQARIEQQNGAGCGSSGTSVRQREGETNCRSSG